MLLKDLDLHLHGAPDCFDCEHCFADFQFCILVRLAAGYELTAIPVCIITLELVCAINRHEQQLSQVLEVAQVVEAFHISACTKVAKSVLLKTEIHTGCDRKRKASTLHDWLDC